MSDGLPETSRKIQSQQPESPAKMPKHNKARKKPRKALDGISTKPLLKARKAEPRQPVAEAYSPYSTKKTRGRPRTIPVNWATGRAYNYGIQLRQVWPMLEAPLLVAKTLEEVTTAFENQGQPYAKNFVPESASDLLDLIHDRKFPKRSDGRIRFLADSLGGRPSLSARSSRDICEKERAHQRRKSQHHIIRHEFWVECTCGYKGPALDNACRKCGAEIRSSIFDLRGPGPF